MSIMQAMYAGSSALTNYGDAMTVIGNNLANANTTAFKTSRTTFEDVLIQTVGVSGTRSATQMGTGVGLSSIDQILQQGSISSTNRVTDLSIDGVGYFKVRDSSPGEANPYAQTPVTGGTNQDVFFTRAGNFTQNLTGDLVNNTGLVLQGWQLDMDGIREAGSSGTTDINLSNFQQTQPRATSLVTVGVNLDANAEVISDPLHSTYDPTDPLSYNHSTTVHVYDSLGKGHNVEIQFRKTAANTWEWHAVARSDELTAASQGPGTLTAVDTITGGAMTAPTGAAYTAGVLSFDNQGRLLTEGSTPLRFNFSDSTSTAAPQDILFDFGSALGALGDASNDFNRDTDDLLYTAVGTAEADAGAGTDATVQHAGDFTTKQLRQDGMQAGYLDSIQINQDGTIYGTYTNGLVRPLYQIALVDFDNPAALEQIGANLFAETNLSGLPREGEAGSGRLGDINSYSLEQSNVDMSGEFVTMITTQRAFQANSRIVTVTDGMLEELIAMKR
ncbi:MAG: flagellar hook protein FlgE [Magnetococcus sp. WYHC-3]